jgi:hypothetical protein
MLEIGDAVETVVDLPGIPRGSSGRVKEVEALLVAVEFDEGRIGYYSPRQLRRVPAPPDQQKPAPGR